MITMSKELKHIITDLMLILEVLKERQFQDSRKIELDLQDLMEQISRWDNYTNVKQDELIGLLMNVENYLIKVGVSDIAESLRDIRERLTRLIYNR